MDDQKPVQPVVVANKKLAAVPAQNIRFIDGIEEKLHQRIVAKVGLPVRGKKPIKVNLALKLHKAGFSWRQIGTYFGVSGCTVKRRLREVGLI